MFSSKLTAFQNRGQDYLKEYKISNTQQGKFTMSGIQKKIMKYAKKQENTNHNEKKNQSIGMFQNDTDDRIITQDINTIIFHMFKIL